MKKVIIETTIEILYGSIYAYIALVIIKAVMEWY